MFTFQAATANQDQYTPERVRDAISILNREAGHLSNIPTHIQRLPQDLARILQSDRHRIGLRVQAAVAVQPPVFELAHQEDADPGGMFRRPRNDGHLGALGHLEALSIPESTSMFEKRQVGVGCYVATRRAGSTFAASAGQSLEDSNVWIWKVIYMYPKGSLLPGNPASLKCAETDIYDSQLYSPAACGSSLFEPLDPVWESTNSRNVVYTPSEKDDRDAQKKIRKYGEGGRKLMAPVTAFLRPSNIIGGGFSLNDESIVPSRIRSYIETILERQPLLP